MRLATIQLEDQELPVVLDEDRVLPLHAPSMLAALQADPRVDSWELGEPLKLDGEPILQAPLRPGKIVAIGLNYHDHIRETGLDAPSAPLIFAKFTSCVAGPQESIVLPAIAPEHVDWEVELAVVIGRRMRHVPLERALDFVFGYTVANDVSARDVQFADGQWIRGKSFDTFCPLGPALVTSDELPDPQALKLSTRVNGELVQDSSTSEMIFSTAEILSYCSSCFTLDPGDIVLTGTPWGCGGFMEPPRALHSGDLLESYVEGIGTMRNPVVQAASSEHDSQPDQRG
jgi:2-keto-4-pentenoate hydratase/2-oxohepta-3-ene-1,7-dioic acid hydratase in catechol pathway